jgi:diguanylate cyclase (GGDEF)-like protein
MVMKPATNEPDKNDLLSAVLECYRCALSAMGRTGTQVCPGASSKFQETLADLSKVITAERTADDLRATEKKVEEEIKQWGGQSSDYFTAKTNEVKELLILLARTAQSVGDRDQRYTSQFSQFTTRLQNIANLEDLTQVRASLVEGAAELKTYVDRMAKDSRESLAKLQAEVAHYETKVKAVEELALQDSLTGLANRRNAEGRIEWRMSVQQPFCVMMIDLNKFKQINDTYGHSAGDSLLKQFAEELRSNLRTSDVAARWGGDEFIVISDCDLAGAKCLTDRLRKWVLGDYTVQRAGSAETVKVLVDASIGAAQWQKGESIDSLVERADTAMYDEKRLGQNDKGRAAHA